MIVVLVSSQAASYLEMITSTAQKVINNIHLLECS